MANSSDNDSEHHTNQDDGRKPLRAHDGFSPSPSDRAFGQNDTPGIPICKKNRQGVFARTLSVLYAPGALALGGAAIVRGAKSIASASKPTNEAPAA